MIFSQQVVINVLANKVGHESTTAWYKHPYL